MLTVDYDKLGVQPGELVLDIGCGTGRHTYALQRRGAIPVAVDLDPVALGETAGMMWAVAAEEDVPLGSCVAADALRLPFPDATFDRIIASEVLEHISDDRAAMREIGRVLKPGGTVAASVPRFWPETLCWALSSEYHNNDGGHVRIYRRSQLVDRFRERGLRPYATHHAHAFHAPYWWLRCLVDLDGKAAPVDAYRRFLVWDIQSPNRAVRALERTLDPLVGKSFVVYLTQDGVDEPV